VPVVLPVYVRPRYASCQWKADIPDILTKKLLVTTFASGCSHRASCPSIVSLSALSG
jgi:hypothetical protein